MNGFLSAWLVEAGIVSWRAWKRDKRPPLPSEYVAVFVVYGALGLLAEVPNARQVASVTGWGIVLATALNLIDPRDPFKQGRGVATSVGAPVGSPGVGLQQPLSSPIATPNQ